MAIASRARPKTNPNRLRAVGYCRVSTKRQADHQISLEEQDKKIDATCVLRDADLVETFIEPGLTARVDRRPELKRMLEYACDPANRIDLVIVYAFSRFFRNARQYLNYKERLKEAGVRLVSATQDIPEGPHGELMETILAAFDGHQSEVNAGIVRDMMMANAEEGYWNGSAPPFGYRTKVALVLRRKEKKVLEIDEEEAAIVNKVFRLYLRGHEGGGPMGIKAITTHLNTKGYRYRGKAFYTASVERILKNEAYIGIHYYNRIDSRTRKVRPPAEWIKMEVPSIVEAETFDAVQRTLQARNPRKTAPRVVTGATLLTGIAVCEKCGRGMMLRTGKGGRYRYLTCAKRATEGTGCGHSIRMDKVDELVIKAMEDHVFRPDRLTAILETMTDRTDDTRQQLEAEIDRQRIAVGEAQARLDRLYDAIEAGVAELHDPRFKERVDLAKLQIREGTANLASLRQRRSVKAELSPAMVRRFSSGIRRRLRDSDPSFRRTWVHMFVSKVTIGRDCIRICGPKDQRLKAASDGEDSARAMVPTFAREWRARRDSNS
ncbi:recombinase family protein [Devosia sediminis]|uniref:Recombinase family protein n=1 Tax=Devosia sediminis TaxID=2798801 RepID=A0A934J0U3_9HYPH|nr:recombinase family protein [Devosia sediminis]MBJ3786851.1 recombinase family protein [Devosia sediminis]